MVKFLLEHKANAADRDKYERTALMLNAENEENAQQDGSLCKMLVDAGCPINAQDTMGKVRSRIVSACGADRRVSVAALCADGTDARCERHQS